MLQDCCQVRIYLILKATVGCFRGDLGKRGVEHGHQLGLLLQPCQHKYDLLIRFVYLWDDPLVRAEAVVWMLSLRYESEGLRRTEEYIQITSDFVSAPKVHLDSTVVVQLVLIIAGCEIHIAMVSRALTELILA